MKTLKMAFLLAGSFLALGALAANIEVKMMTAAPDKQSLTFYPMYTKAKVGDTVTFIPEQKAGHTSISLLVPPGAKPWEGKPDTPVSVKMTKEGIYLVVCRVHRTMGMVAVVQVGKPVNLEEARKAAAAESAKMAINKDRFEKALALVK